MKKVLYGFLSFICIIGLVSCSESKTQEIYLDVSPTILTIPSEGGHVEFQVNSNTTWAITSDEPDIWISPNSGTGDREVQVSLPKSESAKQKEIRLVVKSQDGSIVRNVNVKQEGVFLSGATLTVTNHNNLLPFAGAAGDVDSLMILSNLSWQIKGPDWIEAYNGSRWVALSPDRATVQGGGVVKEGTQTTSLLLRTAKVNDQERSLEDKIILTPTYDDYDIQLEINVVQLGKHTVYPNVCITLASEMATDWKCGSDVDYFFYCLSDHLLTEDELTTEIISNWEASTPEYVTGWDDLQENTLYYLYSVGVDKNNTIEGSVFTAYSTQTSQNQPIAVISDVEFSGSIWSWAITRNDYCNGFVQWKTTDTDFFEYSTGVLAWFLNNLLHDEESQKDLPFYYKDTTDSWETPYHIQLLTWGVGENTNKTSNVLDRYRSIDYYESATRGADCHSLPKLQSVKKDVEGFRKRIIRVK